MHECIAVSEALGDYDALIHYTTQMLRHQHQQLSREEQIRLIGMLQRVVQEGLQNSNKTVVDTYWWRESFFRGLEVQRPTPSRVPHAQKETQQTKGPFLYDPYEKRSADLNTLLVVDELSIVLVSVWNPFMVDLEIQSLSLLAQGVSFDIEWHPVSIPQGSVSVLRLHVFPRESGMLSIKGVQITTLGGLRQAFSVIGLDDVQSIEKERAQFELLKRARNKKLYLKSYYSYD